MQGASQALARVCMHTHGTAQALAGVWTHMHMRPRPRRQRPTPPPAADPPAGPPGPTRQPSHHECVAWDFPVWVCRAIKISAGCLACTRLRAQKDGAVRATYEITFFVRAEKMERKLSLSSLPLNLPVGATSDVNNRITFFGFALQCGTIKNKRHIYLHRYRHL